MSIFDLFSMAFMNLWRRKLRAALTVLGMIVGTASIVVMISLGIGVNAGYLESLEKTGSLMTIKVQPESYDAVPMEKTSARGGGASSTKKLDDKSVAFFTKLEGVHAVTPIIYGGSSMLKAGKYFAGLQLIGIDSAVAEQFGIEVAEGTMFKRNDSKPEIIFGSEIVRSFSDPISYKPAVNKDGNPLIDPLHASMKLTFDWNNIAPQQPALVIVDPTVPSTPKGKMYAVKIVGLIGATNGGELDYQAFMDINTMKKLAKENKDFFYMPTTGGYNEIWVKCDTINDVERVQKQIKAEGYGAWSLADALNMAKESSKQLQALLGAIGGVSLFVAALGIMNTMLMSIYERTKEIGIIKVLGCRMGNILSLFLVEAAYIGLIGGAAGVALSYGISLVVNKLLAGAMGGGMQSVIPLYLSLGALIFSAFVAIASGLYPAVKAMRLSALGAIRSE